MCMAPQVPIPPPAPLPQAQAPTPAPQEYHFFDKPTNFGGTLLSRVYGGKAASAGRQGAPVAQMAARMKEGMALGSGTPLREISRATTSKGANK